MTATIAAQRRLRRQWAAPAVRQAGLPSASATSDTPVSCWQPQPGQQARAFACEADQIGYGGAAGGGKSELALGKAATGPHKRAIIFRRVLPSLAALADRSREFYDGSYNSNTHTWRLTDGRTVRFASVQRDQDKAKYQGQPYDLMVFDEVTEFPELLVRFLMGWNRSADPGVRCQVLMTFNPPMDDTGIWVTRFFAPWLDPAYPTPATDGEVRYFSRDAEGIEREVPLGAPGAKSRTFFHASLIDNPALAATGYGDTIEALPEPLRSFLKGNFNAARGANPWQVIPTAWVEAAQHRWTAPTGEATAAAMDVARGGDDRTVIARLYGLTLAELEIYPGAATPDGQSAAALLVNDVQAGIPIGIDVIGWGSSAYDQVRDVCPRALAINSSEKAVLYDQVLTDHSGTLRFANIRTAMYWQLREALDPAQGTGLALPPSDALRAELCQPQWRLRSGGVIEVESKDAIKRRLGTSPDLADAAVMVLWTAQRGADWLVWGHA